MTVVKLRAERRTLGFFAASAWTGHDSPKSPAVCVVLLGLLLAGLTCSPAAYAQQDGANEDTGGQPAAQPEEEEDVYAGQAPSAYNPETAVFGPLPRFKTADGNINVGGGALFQFDGGTYHQNAQGGPATTQALAPDLESGFRARRGILVFSGLFYQDFIFFAAHDLFDRGDQIMDGQRSAVLAWRGLDPLWLLVGQQNTSPPLDASTFSSQRLMIEPAMSSAVFGFSPGIPSLGAATLYRTKHNYLKLGLYGVPAKEIGGDSEGYGLHWRATWAPIAERTRALHVGTAGYWRKPTVKRGEFGGSETFSSVPEITIDSTSFVDTGRIRRIDSFNYNALEFLGVYDSFSFQAEYQRVEIDRYNGPHDLAFRDLSFNGYYAQVGYYLTGESPNYYSRFATLWRVNPKREFDLDTGGWGAFEVGARFSHIDLDDGVNDLARGGIRGGTANNITLGLNWYPHALMKISVNYIHSDIDNLSNTGLQEGEEIDALLVRFQYEF